MQRGGANVIALGGGAWIEKANRDVIKKYSCISVWLDTPFEVCWERISAAVEERPLGKTRDQAQALYDRRKSIYELARIHISVSPNETVDDLVSRIQIQLDRKSSEFSL